MNPLYQYPAEANLLKSGQRGADYRDAWKQLADAAGKQAAQSADPKLKRLYICGTGLLVLSIVLAAVYVLLEILFHVMPPSPARAEGMNGVHVVFALATAVPAALCWFGREYVRDSILRYHLRTYEPVCTQYGTETLRQIGEVLRGEHVTATGHYVCLRCRRGCRYDETRHTRDAMYCPVCGGETLVGRITGGLFDVCCNYQAELDALAERNTAPEARGTGAEDGEMTESGGKSPAD